jgi:hypothetical protein
MALLFSTGSGNITDGTFPCLQGSVGANPQISTGDIALDGVTTFTICGWVKKGVLTNVAVVGSKGTSTTNQLYLTFQNGNIRCNVSNGTNTYGDFTFTNDLNWHFFSMVYDGSGATNADKLKLYIDGTQRTLTFTGTIPSTAPTNANSFTIGSYYPSGTVVYSDFSVSHVTVHSTALTDSNITTLYNSGNGVKDASIVGTLINGWLFNEGSGTTIYDYAPSVNSSTTGFNGTSTVSTWSTGVITSGNLIFNTPTAIGAVESETTTWAVTTTPTSICSLSIATGINVEGLAVNIATINSTPSGTFTIKLKNTTDNIDVKTVTVNISDLGYSAGTTNCRGWYYFKFDAAYAGITGKTYNVYVSTSISSQITFLTSTNSSSSVSCYYISSTRTYPAIGDRLLICGELTGQGTGNDHLITMDDLTPKAYGIIGGSVGSNAISGRGSITSSNIANKTFYFRQKGICRLNSGGKFTPVSTPLSTCKNIWNFDLTSNVDSGWQIRNGSKDGGLSGYQKTIFKTILTADVSVSATTLTVQNTTDWLSNDSICIGGSTRQATTSDTRTISTVNSETSITVSSGLTNAHSGTTPANCPIANLTRSFKIGGESASLQAFIDIEQYAGTQTFSGIEFYWLGSATTNFRGIDIKTGYSTKECNFVGCVFKDFIVASSIINISGSSYDRIKFQDCCFSNMISNFILAAATTGTLCYITNCIFVGSTNSVVTLSDAGWNLTGDNVINSCSSGIVISETGGRLGLYNAGTLNVSNTGSIGISLTSIRDGTLPTITSWRNTSHGISLSNCANIIIPINYIFGNTTNNIVITSNGGNLTFKNGSVKSDSGYTTTNAINFTTSGAYYNIKFNSIDFSTISGFFGYHTNIITITAATTSMITNFNNCKMSNFSYVNGYTFLDNESIVSIQNKEQLNYPSAQYIYKQTGSIYYSVPSRNGTDEIETLQPSNNTYNLNSSIKKCIINSGSTKNINVYIRKSVLADGPPAYNGSEVKLIIKEAPEIGSNFNSDIIACTTTSAANGNWELLTYTTPTATNNGILEFYIACNGNQGWVSIDDWSIT